MKGDGPTSGPFAALWLLLKQLMGSFGKHGFDFEAAFDDIDRQCRQLLLEQVIAMYNADHPGAPRNAADFELRLVKRGRRCEYDIFAKDGRTLAELDAQAFATRKAEAIRTYFHRRRLYLAFVHWTQIRAIWRPRRSVYMRRIGPNSRRITARRLLATRGCSAAVLSAATQSRAPP
jgi:hypothetical protein